MKTKAIAAINPSSVAEELTAHAAALNNVELQVSVCDPMEFISEVDLTILPPIVIVEVDLDQLEQIRALEELIGRCGQAHGILVTAHDASLAQIRQLMRMGVIDFIPQPINAADLNAAVETAVQKTKPQNLRANARGNVVSVMRSCGGSGATTVAIELAAAFAKNDKGDAPSVALLDFDMQQGNVAIALDLMPKVTLLDILESPSRLDTAYLKGSMSRHKSGIDVLAAPSEIIPLEGMTEATARTILTIARQEYDYVVIDMPSTWTSWTAAILDECDENLMVMQLSVVAIQRVLRNLHTVKEQGLSDKQMSIVANRVSKGIGFSGADRVKEFETALKRPIEYTVRNDFKTAAGARDRGVLSREITRKSVIGQDIERIKDELLARFDSDASVALSA